jgi:hypothetical protein
MKLVLFDSDNKYITHINSYLFVLATLDCVIYGWQLISQIAFSCSFIFNREKCFLISHYTLTAATFFPHIFRFAFTYTSRSKLLVIFRRGFAKSVHAGIVPHFEAVWTTLDFNLELKSARLLYVSSCRTLNIQVSLEMKMSSKYFIT